MQVSLLRYLVPLLVILHFLFRLGFGWGAGAPDLLILALLLAVRGVGMGMGAGLGLFLGLLEDAFSVLAFGANAVAMTLVGALGARTRDIFVGDSLLFAFAYVGLGKWLRDLVHWIVVGEGVREPFVNAMLVDGLFSAIYVGLVGMLVMTVFGRTEVQR
jgi:rod shape-determining protein MreD